MVDKIPNECILSSNSLFGMEKGLIKWCEENTLSHKFNMDYTYEKRLTEYLFM